MRTPSSFLPHLAKGLVFSAVLLAGCRYYGSAVPPDYPLSMDSALSTAQNMRGGSGGMQNPVIRQSTRPKVDRPSYLPEKELALVSPPQTLLLWTYPHITDDNTRVFGNWSTIFLTDRYQWARPANELPLGQDDAGGPAGRPNLGAAAMPNGTP
ncbi:MAG: hypothetical protein GC129_01475 [Proteobacteria bacterium]|nr:hypothetical protein [Pseudomonadota bacterium]